MVGSCWGGGMKSGRMGVASGFRGSAARTTAVPRCAGMTHLGNRMKIEAITLREIRKCRWCISSRPASDAPPSARILLVTLHGDGLEGWGECVAGEDPFYSEEYIEARGMTMRVTWRRRCWAKIVRRRARCRRCWRVSRDIAWPRRRWKTRSGTPKRRRKNFRCGSCWAARGARSPAACQHRHSGFARATVAEDRNRAGRRIPAHQGEGEAGMGRRGAGEDPRPLAGDSAELRRQLRLHARRCRPPEGLRPTSIC